MDAPRPDGRSYRARAWWGGALLAESTAAVRTDEPDRAPTLWFPCSDVRFDLLRDEEQPAGDDSSFRSVDGADGRDVLRVYGEGPDDRWPAGYACFDHDRVRVEIVDGRDGDA